MPNMQNHTLVKVSQIGKVKVQEGRKLAKFVIDPRAFANLNKNNPKHEGWSNSATWLFNTYFFQESALYERFLKLIRGHGIDYRKALDLFHEAQCLNLMEQIDDDCVGPVNVPEIVDNFWQEYCRGK